MKDFDYSDVETFLKQPSRLLWNKSDSTPRSHSDLPTRIYPCETLDT